MQQLFKPNQWPDPRNSQYKPQVPVVPPKSNGIKSVQEQEQNSVKALAFFFGSPPIKSVETS